MIFCTSIQIKTLALIDVKMTSLFKVNAGIGANFGMTFIRASSSLSLLLLLLIIHIQSGRWDFHLHGQIFPFNRNPEMTYNHHEENVPLNWPVFPLNNRNLMPHFRASMRYQDIAEEEWAIKRN